MTSLEVEIRSQNGKGIARKLRASGKVPGVVYGPDSDPVGVAVDPNQLTDIFAKSGNRNTLVELEIDGKKVSCLVREVQRHPLSRDILHVDFYRVADDRTVDVEVPLRAVGKPKGATLGGRIRLIRRSLMARCLPKDIPESFVFDVSPLEIGDMVSSSELPLPDGVSLLLKQDIFVITCYGKRKGGVAAVLEAEEAAAAEAEAEGEGAEGESAEGETEGEA